jgi:hypothetical protein
MLVQHFSDFEKKRVAGKRFADQMRILIELDAFALIRGATQPVSSKQEAEKVWEPKFIGEIVSGRALGGTRVRRPRRRPLKG